MTVFIVWAALCAVAAALCIAVPLLRHRSDGSCEHRWWGGVAGLLVALSAAILYPIWSNWPWRTSPTAQNETIAALVAATTAHPDDLQTWLDLGRGYLRLEQWALARRAYQRADRSSQGTSAAALSGLGEIMIFENDGNQNEAAEALFNRALKLDPYSPQALFYTGVALLRSGDLAAARARFAALRALAPPTQVVEALDKQIAALDAQITQQKTADPTTTIHLIVSVLKALAAKIPANASLFVFVRAPQGGTPLAVKRLSATVPQHVDLSAADSMLASSRITPGQKVQVYARISATGQPIATTGDLFGEVNAVAGANQSLNLVVDRVTP